MAGRELKDRFTGQVWDMHLPDDDANKWIRMQIPCEEFTDWIAEHNVIARDEDAECAALDISTYIHNRDGSKDTMIEMMWHPDGAHYEFVVTGDSFGIVPRRRTMVDKDAKDPEHEFVYSVPYSFDIYFYGYDDDTEEPEEASQRVINMTFELPAYPMMSQKYREPEIARNWAASMAMYNRK